MVFDLNTTSESAGTTEDAFSNGDLTAIGNELFFVATNGDSDGFQLMGRRTVSLARHP